MSGIVLYGPAFSNYVWSVRIALAEKAVDYELVELPFGAQREEPHLSRHPFGKVPAFEHDDLRLYETQAILRYLDDAFPAPRLQPDGARARARMNQAMGILDAYGWPSIAAGILFNRRLAPRLGLPVDEDAIAAAVPRARLVIREWTRLLADGPFLAGAGFSLADVLVAPLVFYYRQVAEGEAALAEHPALVAWNERIAARASFRDTRPPTV
jgi:Glutathione S-transferase